VRMEGKEATRLGIDPVSDALPWRRHSSATSGPASKFRCPKLDLLPAGFTKNNFRSYVYASDFSFSQRPKYLRF
jgi:hypothetical protein